MSRLDGERIVLTGIAGGIGSIASGNAGSNADIAGIIDSVLLASAEELATWGSEHVGPIEKTQRTGGIVH